VKFKAQYYYYNIHDNVLILKQVNEDFQKLSKTRQFKNVHDFLQNYIIPKSSGGAPDSVNPNDKSMHFNKRNDRE
jgi:hypothetical protein